MTSCYSSLSLPIYRRLHHNSHISLFFSPPPRRLYRYLLFSNATTIAAVAASLPLPTVRPDQPLPYGPSLRRGRRLLPPQDSTEADAKPSKPFVDEESFARVFDLAALRVPAAECSALEGRLRGHLLNWPRVRNVARVPGDDLDPEVGRMLRVADGDGGQRLAALAKRTVDDEGPSPSEDDEETAVAPLNPVLYREKLVKEFNFRGFLKFRNLAKISRPKKSNRVNWKGGDKRNGDGLRRGSGKNDFAVVEVIGNGGEQEEDLSGLLGEEFKRGRWRGPSRLLLLDEQYAGKSVNELPEAVKVVLHDNTNQALPSTFELVRCQLTLFYNYWHMNEILQALLPEGMIVPTGFETVGHIAHLNLRDEHLPYKKLIAQVILDKNRPKIQTVVNKTDAIQNDYRTMQLEVLAGNHSLVTTVIENGIHFQVDLATVYWNSKLATERQRLISVFTSADVICDVFSGVGPIAISAAKKVKYVYANDLNPNAVEYLERNIVLNRLDRKVEVSNMDGRRFITNLFSNPQRYSITQVVLNLPNDAAEFLDAFKGIFRNRARESCTLPKIHVYGFSKADNPEYDFHERINMVLCESITDIEMHRVRLVAPGKWMLCASFVLPQAVTFRN